MNPSTALARVLVDELARGGLTDAVLAPGSRSAPLAMALHDDPRVRVHVEIDERSAGFLAVGLAKATGRAAAVTCTSGTAGANLHPAVVEAHHARVPLLVLTADRPPELRHAGANQTIDQLGLFGASARWFVEVGVPEARAGAVAYWRSLACQALAVAHGGPPGPVHANLALREPLVPDDGGGDDAGWPEALDGRPGGRPWTSLRRGVTAPGDEQLTELAERIGGTERGVVVAGDTTVAPAALLDLARAAGWPLLAEPLSGARAGPHAVSTYHQLLSTGGFAAAHRPDLVVRVGRTVLSKPLLAHLDAGVPQLLVDADGAWLDPARAAAEVWTADPAAVCTGLAQRLTAQPASGWLGAWQDAERRARTVIDGILDEQDAPSEPRTARDLAAALPARAVLVAASSMPVRDLDAFMAPRGGLRVLGNRGASGIDGFVSTALGAALGHDGPTAALAGDLSLLHDQNGFLLADRPDLVLVVVNNDGGGIFSFLPQAAFPASFEPLFGTPHGLDLARLAGLHGLAHQRVEQARDLGPAVAAGLEAGGIHLVEVRTDRAANVALHRRLAGAVAAELDG